MRKYILCFFLFLLFLSACAAPRAAEGGAFPVGISVTGGAEEGLLTQPPAEPTAGPDEAPTVPPTSPQGQQTEPSAPTQETEPSTVPEEQLFSYKGLVELTVADDSFVIDQRYATADNFTGRIHYDRVLVLVQEDILPMLIAANNAAKAEGFRIKIWDAYRPISVQHALHDSAPEELSAYVPAPGPYSMHARGITVDVTLCDLDGKELDMPTGFDDFSERAHSDYAGATDAQIANRERLCRFMTQAGFTRSRLEWWHFDGPNRDNYEILDVSFGEYEAAREAVDN